MKKNKFPVIKNIKAKTLASDIKGAKPMSIEEAVKGRTIKPYPAKYDAFDSYELLKKHIKKQLFFKEKLKAEWLDVSFVGHLPFNFEKDVYYTGYSSIQITCYEPTDGHPCIVEGESLCELNPIHWDINKIESIVNEIKNEQKHITN
jgi:hypothetical protein